jgi:hypothetical protein
MCLQSVAAFGFVEFSLFQNVGVSKLPISLHYMVNRKYEKSMFALQMPGKTDTV